MLDDKVCGTWWYCVNANGSRWIVDGDRPKALGGHYTAQGTVKYGWICLDGERYGVYKGTKISKEDFIGVKFPEIIYEDGPLEIEIVKSGNVYWYDN